MGDMQNKLYENSEFQEFAADSLHPGGLELTAEAVDLAGFQPGSRLLDIGCGCGKTVAFLADRFRISGIDSSTELIARAKSRHPGLDVIVGSADDLPYPEQSLEGVLAECVLSVLPEKEKALAEIRRVLKPSGRLATSDLYIRQSDQPFTGLPLVTCLNGMKSDGEIIAEMAANGFRLLAWEDKTVIFKGFLASLIMNYGSMAVFWQSLLGEKDTACQVQTSLRGIKIGYYLAVWQKSEALG